MERPLELALGPGHAVGEHAPAARRIVVTVPSRELAEQNERALLAFFDPSEIGVACAALGRRETGRRVVVGTPQSLAGAIDFDPTAVIVDEAHMMPLHKGSHFARLFDALPRRRETPRIGLSATTFRTADGALYGKPQSWFTSQPFEISVAEFVAAGFLAPVRYVQPDAVMTTSGIKRSAGDYHQGELARANLALVEEQAGEILEALAGRRKAMVFAVNVEHAEAFVAALAARGHRASLVVGQMTAEARRASVAAFKAGVHRIAVTVSAALTGFDVPDVDLIASCRPTMSAIIHTQSIGRGTRRADGKADCLVLDFARNVTSFGPVHRPHFDGTGQPLAGAAPWRACASCGTYCHFEDVACAHCGDRLPKVRAVTARDLEFGYISFARESAAIEGLVREHRTLRFPVEPERLAETALAAARAQSIAVPGEATVAILVRELAAEALAVRARLAVLDKELHDLVTRHPDGALIRSLPGMGVVLSAEFIAAAGDITRFRSPDAMAAAAGLAPILRQSGKTRALRRAYGGDRALKRVFYQSAFCAVSTKDPTSRAFYDRKRREGQPHVQAIVALARRRITVIRAMLTHRQTFNPLHRAA